MSTPHDVMARMMTEISAGMSWGSAGSRVEQTEENRVVWEELARDMAAIQSAGMVVAIPNDTEVW